VFRKRLAVLVAAAMMLMMSASPALAAPSGFGHLSRAGCKDWGAFVSTRAHNQRMDNLARKYTIGPAFYGDWNLYIRFTKEVVCT
jgi:hypothetical protein